MRIVFIGAVLFSRRLLAALLDAGAEVVGVVCKPGSTVHADFARLDDLAEGRPMLLTKSLAAADVTAWLQQRQADVAFCFGWSQLIGPELRAILPRGFIGYHPTLLPLGRGRHPIIWALVHGLRETGSTFFQMDDGADSGPILSQRRVPIDADMDAGQLYERLARVASEQVIELWRGLSADTLRAVEQDHAHATYWPKRTAADGVIDWRTSSAQIHNLVRALARPYPGATFAVGGRSAIVWRVQRTPSIGDPGRILRGSPRPIVATADGAIELIEYDGPTLCEGERL